MGCRGEHSEDGGVVHHVVQWDEDKVENVCHQGSCPTIDTRESFLEVLTTGSDAGTTAGGGAATC